MKVNLETMFRKAQPTCETSHFTILGAAPGLYEEDVRDHAETFGGQRVEGGEGHPGHDEQDGGLPEPQHNGFRAKKCVKGLGVSVQEALLSITVLDDLLPVQPEHDLEAHSSAL